MTPLTNQQRAQDAYLVIHKYGDASDNIQSHITDVMHYCDGRKLDFDEICALPKVTTSHRPSNNAILATPGHVWN